MDHSTGRVGAVDPALPPETDERARELRAEIAETRGEMSETIEAIQERLSPSNIVASAKETVKSATTEKVKQMANTAGDAADRVMHNTFMDTIRENPVPAAMIGFGAAWLLMKGRPADRRNGGYGYGEDYDRTGVYGEQYDWRTRTGASTLQYGDVDSGQDTTGSIRSAASDAASRASEAAGQVRATARRTTRRAQLSFDRVMRENPLALGAAATLVGAVIGMSMPSTDTEDELMGDARDTVVERARGIATDAAERVQNAAEQVKDVASRTAEATRVPDQPTRTTGRI